MSTIPVVSVLVRLVAVGWSLVVARRLRDRRVLFLTGMLMLMATRQVLTLAAGFSTDAGMNLNVTGHLDELPGLMVSLMAFLLVLNLEELARRDFLSRKTISDMTESKRISDALQLSEERHRGFVENSTDGIYLCEFDTPMPVDLPVDEQVRRLSTDCFFAICNDAFARMYGYESGQQMLGMRAIELYGSHDNEANDAFLRRMIHNGYRVSEEVSEEFDRDGNRVVFSNNCLGIVEDGHLIRVWGTQRDITERRVAEQKIASQLAELRRWHDVMLGRESRILELKADVNELLAMQEQPPRYRTTSELQAEFDQTAERPA